VSKPRAFDSESGPLTPAVFYILLALATRDRHGYEIMKEVEADSNGAFKLGPGTLYGAIKRLLEDRLIVELDSDHSRRRYYQLTEKGRAIFSRELQRYDEAVALATSRKLLGGPSESTLAYG
jgi:DNA-binding PadR family transcriptional regulator